MVFSLGNARLREPPDAAIRSMAVADERGRRQADLNFAAPAARATRTKANDNVFWLERGRCKMTRLSRTMGGIAAIMCKLQAGINPPHGLIFPSAGAHFLLATNVPSGW